MRLFVDKSLQCGHSIELNVDQGHYVQHVLRHKLHDYLFLFNGQQPLGNYRCQIDHLSKKIVRLRIIAFEEKTVESSVSITLYQGISKAERMDVTIQKSVELGVSAIVPLKLERSHVKLSDPKRLSKKLTHWQKICQSALEQSGRTAKVIVHSPLTLDELIQTPPSTTKNTIRIVLDPLSPNNLCSINTGPVNNIAVLIGPEGGLSQHELASLNQAGFLNIQLGPRILRTETAGLAIISVIQSLWGDF